jgi:hypothetical protein
VKSVARLSGSLPSVALNMRFDISYGNNARPDAGVSFRHRARHEVNLMYPGKKKEA